jgi:hypothetical protein
MFMEVVAKNADWFFRERIAPAMRCDHSSDADTGGELNYQEISQTAVLDNPTCLMNLWPARRLADGRARAEI